MSKFYFVSILCTFCFFTKSKVTFCQSIEENKNSKKQFILSPGISLQKSFFAELNLTFANKSLLENFSETGTSLIIGPRIGLELGNINNRTFIAPKIGYEVSGMFFCLRGNLVYYIENGNNDLRILPEIGISYLGFANLTYGYGFPITKNKIEVINNSNVRLTFNLSKKLWKRIRNI
jgi:hypothetical protein